METSGKVGGLKDVWNKQVCIAKLVEQKWIDFAEMLFFKMKYCMNCEKWETREITFLRVVKIVKAFIYNRRGALHIAYALSLLHMIKWNKHLDSTNSLSILVGYSIPFHKMYKYYHLVLPLYIIYSHILKFFLCNYLI